MHKTTDEANNNRINWKVLIMLIIISIGVQNSYWLSLFNVTNLKGNKFINGLLFGIAETLAGFCAGILIRATSSSTAFQIMGFVCVALSIVNQFLPSSGGFLSYATLFTTRLCMAGVYAALYVLFADFVPTAQVGGTMVLSLTVAYLTVTSAPMIVLIS